MRYEVLLLPTNEYVLEEIVLKDIPEKYWYNEHGDICFTATIFYSEKAVYELINFLFQASQPITEVYRNGDAYVLDLNSNKNNLINFDYVERYYFEWLNETGRKNTMNEYGMLTDFVGFARKGIDKKHLLMIVSNGKF